MNYDHRKQWILDRMQFLAGQFGLDKLGAIPQHLAPILERLHIVDEGWMQLDLYGRCLG